MSASGLSTRQRTDRSASRGGPPRRGRSDDQPPRSSSEILTLRAFGGVGMPSMLAYRVQLLADPVVELDPARVQPLGARALAGRDRARRMAPEAHSHGRPD